MTLAATRRALLAGATASLAGLWATPARAANVLRWSSASDALTFDPHAFGHGTRQLAIQQVYEYLVDLTTEHRLEPGLAVAWRLVGPTIWEFEIRAGVRFHDGTPLTADDAAFSLRRATSGVARGAGLLWPPITSAEAVGEHTVRVTTAEPNPLLPVQLTDIMIMSRNWAEQHGASAVTPRDQAETAYAERHANGTGPFRLESFEPGTGSAMTRNRDWWGLGLHPHNVDRLVHTKIVDGAEALAALRDDRIDLWISVTPELIEELTRSSGLKVEQADEFRVTFLGFDQGSAELRSSSVKGANPFKDRRVRRAVYQAIDIDAICERIMLGYARPAGMLVPPGVNGYSEELDRRLPYDPDAARQLLAEAGYPRGFAVTLDCPNDRYANGDICRAAAEMLGKVGVAVIVDARPMREHLAKIIDRRTDFYMLGRGTTAFDSYYNLVDLVRGGARYNATGFAVPVVDELIDEIGTELSTYVRDALIERVWQVVHDEIVYVPLHQPKTVWAMRDTLELPIDSYAGPRFQKAQLRR